MALHGEIKVNHHIIGEWSAQRAGTADDDYIYRCTVEFRDMAGYTHDRTFWVRHAFMDGALALTAKVMIACDEAMEEPAYTETTSWHSFCAEHNLDPTTALGGHIELRS